MHYYDVVYYDKQDSQLHSFLFSSLTECDGDEPPFIAHYQYPKTWDKVFSCPVVGKRLLYLKQMGRIRE